MDEQTLVIRFEGTSLADVNRYAEDLRRELMDADSSVRVTRRRDDKASMDFGGTLVLVLGTPAMVVIAQALQKWVTRNNAASIRVETKDGTLIVSGLESRNAAAVVDAFSRLGKA